ncbi:MAG: hypothetical protein WAO55_00480, partial [Candidatus Manganitrophaceae bacterium]
MTTRLVSQPVSSHRCIAPPAGLVVIAVGCLVLLGWTFDIVFFKSVFPGFVSMNPTTALGFILSGAALRSLIVKETHRGFRILTRVCGFVIALLGALKLGEYLFHWNLEMDRLLFREAQGAAGASPSRIAATTALNFLLLGSAFVFHDVETRRGRRPAHTLILLAAFVSFLAVIGYTYGVKYFYGISMALHTALTFIALCAGLLCARPKDGLMQMITSDRMGGIIMRRLLPAALVLPIFLGSMELMGLQAGWYDTEFGSALYAALR